MGLVNRTIDDPVLYGDAHRGSILEVLPRNKVRVKFDDRTLIPNVMDVEANHLKWYLDNGATCPFAIFVFRCPRCDVPWKMKQGFSFNHYDCPICGDKRDRYVS